MKKSFTENTLARFERENRSTGINEFYQPWHQVKRSEPSSIGKSGRHFIINRPVHTLSTVEYICVLFSTMNINLVDIREQFALNLESANHELNSYHDTYGKFYLGTIDIAKTLGFKHPHLRDGSKKPWRMTTDILITLKSAGGLKLLAVSCKKNLPESFRKWELLLIEKEYWRCRDVEWLLISPDLYDRGFAGTLRSFRHFALSENLDLTLRQNIVDQISLGNYSYTDLLLIFSNEGYSIDKFQNAFWNGFWYGDIPMQIRVKFEPSRKIQLISKDNFLLKNPIYSGRSSCI